MTAVAFFKWEQLLLQAIDNWRELWERENGFTKKKSTTEDGSIEKKLTAVIEATTLSALKLI